MSRRSIICLSLRLRQIIDLLATDKSRYFAQPRPIIVNCSYIVSHWGTDSEGGGGGGRRLNGPYGSLFEIILCHHSLFGTNTLRPSIWRLFAGDGRIAAELNTVGNDVAKYVDLCMFFHCN